MVIAQIQAGKHFLIFFIYVRKDAKQYIPVSLKVDKHDQW